jgi:hypothetical protein
MNINKGILSIRKLGYPLLIHTSYRVPIIMRASIRGTEVDAV